MNKRRRDRRLLLHARAIAATGRFKDWSEVAVELRFRLGKSIISDTLMSWHFRARINRTCEEAQELRQDILAIARMRAELRRICGDVWTRSVCHAKIGRPVRRKLTKAHQRALKAATIAKFVVKYGRKRQRGVEPNDRAYDRDVEQSIKRMNPETLDHLLRDDED